MPSIKKFVCPVCGYDALDEPPLDEFGCATFSICSCCGNEFGYDDFSARVETLRKKWKSTGMKWWSNAVPEPPGFDPHRQLRNVE